MTSIFVVDCQKLGLGKWCMSKNGLKKVIIKFEETGELSVLPERGRKPVANEIIEEVTTAKVEKTSSSSYSSASVQSVSCELTIL